MKFPETLIKRRQELGYTVEKVAELCDWPNGSRISHYENNRREPRFADIEKLAKALQTTASWLLFGVNISSYTVNSSKGDIKEVKTTGVVPLLPWGYVSKWREDENEDLKQKIADIPIFGKFYDDLFALEARNDLMSYDNIEFNYRDGDIFLFRQLEPGNDDIVLVKLEGDQEPIFKKFKKEGGKIYLLSVDNSKLDPREFSDKDKMLGVLWEKLPKSIEYKKKSKSIE